MRLSKSTKPSSKKSLPRLSMLFCLPMLIPFSTSLQAAEPAVKEGQSLEQVVVLSRHGLRAPLATGGSALAKVTPKTWPSWSTPGSYLTTRGGVLEAYFGQYFANWLNDTNLVPNNGCPSEKDIYIYSNSMQRTIATAQYFSVGAYPGCDIKVTHRVEFNKMDPVFNPVITDGSAVFQKQAIAAMNEIAGEGGIEGLNERLKPSYALAARVVDYNNSETCKIDKRCSLTEEPSALSANVNKEPGISGALRTGTIISDALILQYYEGFPMSKVGWGNIKSDKEWKSLVEIKDWYTDVLFASPLVAKHISKPLVTYMQSVWTNPKSAKFTFLVGHDSNIASVLSALEVKEYVLPDQFEKTPIGGKIVFQRWKDNATNKQLMKIEYVYQTTDQIREMTILDNEHPPKRIVLAMKGCPIDAQGFCSWEAFQKVMQGLI